VSQTPLLALPYLAPAQAQKHVTVNESLRALDALVHISIVDRDLAAPPASPAEGARYIIAAGATGAWAGQDGAIGAFQDGAWFFYTPRLGWLAWIEDESQYMGWDGAAWSALGAPPNTVALLGVNATADASNRLSVSSPSVLFNHEGAGVQAKLNKASASDTASVLLQTGFSGRAEIGLAGDDDLHVKVSADGAIWTEALVINRTSGAVLFGASVGVPDEAYGAAWNGALEAPTKNALYAKIETLGAGGGGVSDGDKGDITVSASGATWTIDAGVVTYAKLQDVSATARILGRKTAGSGDAEECTLSEILDFVGSPAQGDVLYRDSATWTRLGAGTKGQSLITQGASANPAWQNWDGWPDPIVGNWHTSSGVVSVSNGSAVTANRIYYAPMEMRSRRTISDLGVRITTAVASSNVRLAIYANNAATGRPTGTPLAETGSISSAATGAVSADITGANVTLDAGIYWAAMNSDSAIAVGAIGTSVTDISTAAIGSATLGNMLGSQASGFYLRSDETFGAFPDATSETFTEDAKVGGSVRAPMIAYLVA